MDTEPLPLPRMKQRGIGWHVWGGLHSQQDVSLAVACAVLCVSSTLCMLLHHPRKHGHHRLAKGLGWAGWAARVACSTYLGFAQMGPAAGPATGTAGPAGSTPRAGEPAAAAGWAPLPKLAFLHLVLVYNSLMDQMSCLNELPLWLNVGLRMLHGIVVSAQFARCFEVFPGMRSWQLLGRHMLVWALPQVCVFAPYQLLFKAREKAPPNPDVKASPERNPDDHNSMRGKAEHGHQEDVFDSCPSADSSGHGGELASQALDHKQVMPDTARTACTDLHDSAGSVHDAVCKLMGGKARTAPCGTALSEPQSPFMAASHGSQAALCDGPQPTGHQDGVNKAAPIAEAAQQLLPPRSQHDCSPTAKAGSTTASIHCSTLAAVQKPGLAAQKLVGLVAGEAVGWRSGSVDDSVRSEAASGQEPAGYSSGSRAASRRGSFSFLPATSSGSVTVQRGQKMLAPSSVMPPMPPTVSVADYAQATSAAARQLPPSNASRSGALPAGLAPASGVLSPGSGALPLLQPTVTTRARARMVLPSQPTVKRILAPPHQVSLSKDLVAGIRQTPYRSKLGMNHKVCVKLQTDATCASLPPNLQDALCDALRGIQGTAVHITEMAVRPGCVMITLGLVEDAAAGVDGLLAPVLPGQVAAALLPQASRLLQVCHHSKDAEEHCTVGELEAADHQAYGAHDIGLQGQTAFLQVDGQAFEICWSPEMGSWQLLPASLGSRSGASHSGTSSRTGSPPRASGSSHTSLTHIPSSSCVTCMTVEEELSGQIQNLRTDSSASSAIVRGRSVTAPKPAGGQPWLGLAMVSSMVPYEREVLTPRPLNSLHAGRAAGSSSAAAAGRAVGGSDISGFGTGGGSVSPRSNNMSPAGDTACAATWQIYFDCQVWRLPDKLAEVTGWAPAPHDTYSMPQRAQRAQHSSGLSGALQLLVRSTASGAYLTTDVVHLAHTRPSSLDDGGVLPPMAMAKVRVIAPVSALYCHHPGSGPSSLLLLTAELWQDNVLLSSTSLVAAPATAPTPTPGSTTPSAAASASGNSGAAAPAPVTADSTASPIVQRPAAPAQVSGATANVTAMAGSSSSGITRASSAPASVPATSGMASATASATITPAGVGFFSNRTAAGTAGFRPACDSWWWGAQDQVIAAAVAELTAVSQGLAADAAASFAGLPGYQAYLRDLTWWLSAVRTETMSSGHCTSCATNAHPSCSNSKKQSSGSAVSAVEVVGEGYAHHNHQPPPLPPQLQQQLAEGLLEYAASVGLGGVYEMVYQQLRLLQRLHARRQPAQGCADAGAPSTRVGYLPAWLALSRLCEVVVGHKCDMCEARYKHGLQLVVGNSRLMMSAAAAMLSGGAASKAVMEGDWSFALCNVPWAAMHISLTAICFVAALGYFRPAVPASVSGGVGWSKVPMRGYLIWVVLAWLYRVGCTWSLAIKVMMSQEPAVGSFMFGNLLAWCFALTINAFTEQLQATALLPAKWVTAMTWCVDVPAALFWSGQELWAPSAALVPRRTWAVAAFVRFIVAPLLMVVPRLVTDASLRHHVLYAHLPSGGSAAASGSGRAAKAAGGVKSKAD